MWNITGSRSNVTFTCLGPEPSNSNKYMLDVSWGAIVRNIKARKARSKGCTHCWNYINLCTWKKRQVATTINRELTEQPKNCCVIYCYGVGSCWEGRTVVSAEGAGDYGEWAPWSVGSGREELENDVNDAGRPWWVSIWHKSQVACFINLTGLI